MKLVYIAHPVRGDIEENLRKASTWVRWAAMEMNVCPVAPYITMCQSLDDNDPFERSVGMELDLEILKRCDEIWLCGDRVSEGMNNERKVAEMLGITIRRHTKQESR